MSLDGKLKEIILANVFDAGTYDVEGIDPETVDDVIPLIKQAFTEAGWITPEQRDKVVKMVNDMANLANDAFQLPTIQFVKINKAQTKAQNLMTGQEFYDRFKKELDKLSDIKNLWDGTPLLDAAKRAAGIKEAE